MPTTSPQVISPRTAGCLTLVKAQPKQRARLSSTASAASKRARSGIGHPPLPAVRGGHEPAREHRRLVARGFAEQAT
jgi:hypothetical protein